MKLRSLILMTTCSLPIVSYAFFCPTNFNSINIGDTVAQVEQQCGKPDTQQTTEQEKNVPQQWDYFVPQTVSMGSLSQQGTLKTTVAFDKDGTVINITVNASSVVSSPICGTAISIGNTQDQVKAACGDPTFVNKQQESSNNNSNSKNPDDQKNKIVEYTYNSTPPMTLVFENGVLTQKK